MFRKVDLCIGDILARLVKCAILIEVVRSVLNTWHGL